MFDKYLILITLYILILPCPPSSKKWETSEAVGLQLREMHLYVRLFKPS